MIIYFFRQSSVGAEYKKNIKQKCDQFKLFTGIVLLRFQNIALNVFTTIISFWSF